MLPKTKTDFSRSLQQPAIPVYAPNGIEVNYDNNKTQKVISVAGSTTSVTAETPLPVITGNGSTTTVTSSSNSPVHVRDDELIALIRTANRSTKLTFRAYFNLEAYSYQSFSSHLNSARYTHLINHANEDIRATLLRYGLLDTQGHFLSDLKLTLSCSWSGWKASAGADYATVNDVPVTYTVSGRNTDSSFITLPIAAGSYLSDCCSSVSGSFIRNSVDLSYSRSTATFIYTFTTY